MIGTHNMTEETLFENLLFREKMSEIGMGLIWITPGWDQKWDVSAGSQRAFEQMLEDFAAISGYNELKYVPIVPFGHSAMATYPWNFAAWNPERTLAVISFHGDAFLPLLSGYACAVPAIMAARIVGNQRDRWATIAIAPLLTCGARLPVYAVMIAAFVPDVSVWGVGLQGLVLFALYCLGMVGALVVAWILKHTTGKGENRTLMLELPSYHLPRIDALAHGLWQRACIYLQKVGTIILALTVFLWVLTTFPGAPAGATDPAINYSFAGMLGRALEPLFAPIGFNWQMCISLVPAMGAREVAVSVLGTLYATASDAEDALVPILQHSWTIPMGLSFLAFFVFSPSCFATLAAIKREMGTWKAPAVLWVAYTLLAYAFSFVVYRTALWVCG